MNWLDVLSTIGIPAIFSGIAMLLVTRYYTKKDKQDDSKEKNKKRLDMLESEFNLFKKQEKESIEIIKKQITQLDDLFKPDGFLAVFNNAMQALLRDRIIQMYNYYFKEQQFMSIYARESLDNLYKQYHSLGGNGVVEDLVEKLYSLPTEPPKDLCKNIK